MDIDVDVKISYTYKCLPRTRVFAGIQKNKFCQFVCLQIHGFPSLTWLRFVTFLAQHNPDNMSHMVYLVYHFIIIIYYELSFF